MRNAILAMTMALAFVTGQLSAATPPADVGPGRVAWFDLSTTNLSRSKEFYGKLFDWQFSPVKGTDQAAEINAGGVAVGTIRVAEGKFRKPHRTWFDFVFGVRSGWQSEEK